MDGVADSRMSRKARRKELSLEGAEKIGNFLLANAKADKNQFVREVNPEPYDDTSDVSVYTALECRIHLGMRIGATHFFS